VPDGEGPSLKRGYGFDGIAPAAAEVDREILEAFAGGVPTVRNGTSGGAGASLIALPVIGDGAVVETVAMYF
jgi:hypothetical protein